MTKKIIYIVSILFTVSLIAFLLIKLSPGDPAKNYLRASHVAITEETLLKTRNELGLNKPIIKQYVDWLGGVIKGEFGKSYTQKVPVLTLITRALIPTVQLGLVSFLFLILLSPILGVLSALYNNKILDYIIRGIGYIFVSLPSFWMGYILIIVFSVWLKILPVSGREGIKNLILPCFTLIVPLLAQNIFFIRKNVLDEMKKVHVESAMLRGVSPKKIIFNHLLRNTMIPMITVLSSNIMYVLSGSVLIEEIFAWPGIGKLFATAVRMGDLPSIQAMLLLFGIMSIIINELTQISIKLLNPRLKISMERGK